MLLRSKIDQKVYLDNDGTENFQAGEIFEFDGEYKNGHYFGWYYGEYMILPNHVFEKVTEKEYELYRVEQHLRWIADEVFPNDNNRAIEQCYGFVQGFMWCHDDWYDEITEMWNRLHSELLYR